MIKKTIFIIVLLSLISFLTLFLTDIIDIWSLSLFLIILITLIFFFYQFETEKISSKELSLVAMISAISAVSRIPFAAIPSVQPCTFIIICTGYVFGPIAGFMVGATTALVSNIFLGQGPWTIFQMFAWGLVGLTASILGKYDIKKVGLLVFGVLWGYLFGWIMNLWFWLAYIYPHNATTLIYYMSTSITFDTLHALGNAFFILLLSEKIIEIFKRYKSRFHVEYKDISELEIEKNKDIDIV